MKVLIIGITGFIGFHLAEYCLNREGIEFLGVGGEKVQLNSWLINKCNNKED